MSSGSTTSGASVTDTQVAGAGDRRLHHAAAGAALDHGLGERGLRGDHLLLHLLDLPHHVVCCCGGFDFATGAPRTSAVRRRPSRRRCRSVGTTIYRRAGALRRVLELGDLVEVDRLLARSRGSGSGSGAT